MFKHILVPTDGSPLSDKAVQYSIGLAAATGASLTFLMVTETFHTFSLDVDQVEDTPVEYRKHAKERAERYLGRAALAAGAAKVPFDTVHVEGDQPYGAIIDTAGRNGCDLIVMASHGRRGISALVLGSETVKVLTHTRIPVLVVRSPNGPLPEKSQERREKVPQFMSEQLP